VITAGKQVSHLRLRDSRIMG